MCGEFIIKKKKQNQKRFGMNKENYKFSGMYVWGDSRWLWDYRNLNVSLKTYPLILTVVFCFPHV